MVAVQATAGYRFSLFQIDKTIAADEFLRYHHVRDFPDQQGSVVDFDICLLDQFTSELDMAFPDERCVKIKPVFRMQAGRAKFAVTLRVFSTALVCLPYYIPGCTWLSVYFPVAIIFPSVLKPGSAGRTIRPHKAGFAPR